MPGFGSQTIRLRGMKSRSMKPCGCACALATSSAKVRSSVPRIASVTGLPRWRPMNHSGISSISRRRNASSNGGSTSGFDVSWKRISASNASRISGRAEAGSAGSSTEM